MSYDLITNKKNHQKNDLKKIEICTKSEVRTKKIEKKRNQF